MEISYETLREIFHSAITEWVAAGKSPNDWCLAHNLTAGVLNWSPLTVLPPATPLLRTDVR